MDGWSIALWVVAAYVAVVALMRLMAHKRNEVMSEFHGEVEKEKSRRKAAAAKQANANGGLFCVCHAITLVRRSRPPGSVTQLQGSADRHRSLDATPAALCRRRRRSRRGGSPGCNSRPSNIRKPR